MKRDEINMEIVPTEGANLKHHNGKVVSSEQEDAVILYIGHASEDVVDEDGHPAQQTRAFCFPVPKPLTRARAINAAEMAAYGLNDAMEVASFAAGLARKQREGRDLEEVADHDAFMSWVQSELTSCGIL